MAEARGIHSDLVTRKIDSARELIPHAAVVVENGERAFIEAERQHCGIVGKDQV